MSDVVTARLVDASLTGVARMMATVALTAPWSVLGQLLRMRELSLLWTSVPTLHAPQPALLSATEWTQLLAVRHDKAEDDEVRRLSEAVQRTLDEARPTPCGPRDWHLPLAEQRDLEQVVQHVLQLAEREDVLSKEDRASRMMRQVSAARCHHHAAGRPALPFQDELLFFAQLRQLRSGTRQLLAATEHQATPDDDAYYMETRAGHQLVSPNRHQWGNLVGWRQHRKMIEERMVT